MIRFETGIRMVAWRPSGDPLNDPPQPCNQVPALCPVLYIVFFSDIRSATTILIRLTKWEVCDALIWGIEIHNQENKDLIKDVDDDA